VGVNRRAARLVPGVDRLFATLDATRAERDRLRQQRDGLREEQARLRSRVRDLEVWAAQTEQPSFLASYERLRRVRELAHREHGVLHPIWRVNGKDEGRRFAEEHGVRVPALLHPPTPLEEVLIPSAASFVLKPVRGAASRGVYVLRRHGADRFRSLREGQELGWADVLAQARALVAQGRVGERFLVEEAIPGTGTDELPHDWKCYCLGGRVELVLQKATRGPRTADARFRFWDRDLRDLGPVRHADRHDPTLPAPRHAEALIAVAERLAQQLPGPFVRVDLFEANDGPVFGEVTPHPGGTQRFVPEVDRRLGEAWERAEARALARRLRADDVL
jgi:hypothetical protein